MAQAVDGKDPNSIWIDLYDALTAAVEAEALCCVVSSVLLEEVGQAKDADTILSIAQPLGHQVRRAYSVQQHQYLRAFQNYLKGQSPEDMEPPQENDIFEQSPQWFTQSLHAVCQLPAYEVESAKETKRYLKGRIPEIFDDYNKGVLTINEIVEREMRDSGDTLIEVGKGVYPSGNTFDQLLWASERNESTKDSAQERVLSFLRSDHILEIPKVWIGSVLWSSVAIATRGGTGRELTASDAADIEHISTYAPYCDIFIVDRFLAHLCNKSGWSIGNRYSTEIRTLRPRQIPDFILQVNGIVSAAPQALLARKIRGFMRGTDPCHRGLLTTS